MSGRCPAIAAPVAKLVNACSEIGMSTTRSEPNFLCSPVVTLLTATRTSSPKTQTAGSRSISAPMARLSALRYDRIGISDPRPGPQAVRVEMVEGAGRVRQRALLREPHGLLQQRLDRGVDAGPLVGRQPRALDLDRVAGHAGGHL